MKQWIKWWSNCTVAVNSVVKHTALFSIAVYRSTLSGWWGGFCRFQPTCSHYAQTAYLIHQPLRATQLTLVRLLKCHPLGSFGYDPVPEPMTNRNLTL